MLHPTSIHLYQLQHIETPRLLIRPIQKGDELGLHESILRSAPELRRWMPWARDTRFQTTRDFVYRHVNAWRTQTASDYPLIVLHKASNTIISASGYNGHTDTIRPCFEIGYWIDSTYVGHGFASEVVNALTRYALEALHAIRVQICTQAGNDSSSAVATRCGYRYEAILRNICRDCQTHLPCDGHLFSCCYSHQLPPLEVKWRHDFSIHITKDTAVTLRHAPSVPPEQQPVLEAHALLLRPPRTEDAEKMYAVLTSCLHTLQPQLYWANPVLTLEKIQQHLLQAAAEDVCFLVWDKACSKILGEVWGVMVDRTVPHLTLQMWFDQSSATLEGVSAALTLFVRHLFTQCNAQCITVYIEEKNKTLLKIAKKIGFHPEGTLKNYCRNFVTQELSPALLFSMTTYPSTTGKPKDAEVSV